MGNVRGVVVKLLLAGALASVCLLLPIHAGANPIPTSAHESTPASAAPLAAPAAAPDVPAASVAKIDGAGAVKADGAATFAAEAKKETPGERLFDLTRDDSVLDPTSWSVMVYESRHQLIVYYKGRLFKIYPAVFGRSLQPGGKEWQGDRRTPHGVYEIIKKRPSRLYRWFLRLNYPNLVDRHRYQLLRAGDDVPDLADGDVAGIGNYIGIHGTDEPDLNAGLVNWTTGCISVDNRAIVELDRLLPVGTVVIINP